MNTLYFNIKQAIRFLHRHSKYVLASVLGLSISLTLIVMLLNYMYNENHVDSFHKNADKIYRVIHSDECAFSPPFSQYLKDNVSEINSCCRTFCLSGVLKTENSMVQSDRCFYADSNFFSMFSFPLVAGNSKTVLDTRNKVVLSENFAKVLFQNENPVGKTLTFNGRLTYYVSGIAKDFNESTHFKPVDVIFPFGAMADFMGEESNYLSQYSWRFMMPALYITLDKQVSKATCKNLVSDLNKWYWLFSDNPNSNLQFEPLKEVYLNSVNYGYKPNVRSGNKNVLRLVLFIVLSVCVIAFINFINLTISKANIRLPEFGIKRINGAGFVSFIFSFITEQILIVLAALTVSVLLILLCLPFYNQLMGYHLTFGSILQTEYFLKTIALFALMVISTGTIVMFVILLKTMAKNKLLLKGNSRIVFLQKALLIVQYTMSISLIISMLVILKQKHFIENFNYGFNKKGSLYVKLNREFVGKAEAFKSEIEKIAGVKSVSLCNGMPGVGIFNLRFEKEGKAKDIDLFNIDANYFKTMEVPDVECIELADDECWINESAAKELDYNENEGFVEFLEFDETRKLKVKGILADLNFYSLHQVARPTIFSKINTMRFIDYLLVNIESKHVAEFLSKAKQQYAKFSSKFPFEYAFLNDKMNQSYINDYRTLKLVVWFSIFGIVLSSFGMFSLTLLLLLNKTKEIGIRKVNGAKISEILTMLNTVFVKWMAIAFAIAAPIAYYIIDKWLENFAYKTELSWWIFALAGIITITIALLTVSWQTWRAARRNPVEALRYE